MKNKIISAMLVGMSATMAVPVTAVMAAEGEPTATEATAAEAAVTEETPAEEAPAEETQAEEAVSENEAEEAQEEESVPQVDENGEVTEAAKDAATPADFREKLSTLSFSAEVFGKYADKLTAYATSDAVDKSNLYNCEMSVLDQAERYANGESGEAIKAIKYQIALEFEKVYGEDAFLPGRDIRKAILEDLGKAQDFTACTTIAEADQLYKDNEGIVTLPVDMIKKDDGDISVKPNPGEGENKPSTGGDGTGTGTEGETKPELDTYVSGIQDYEIKVGEDIDTSSISYNAEHISSVELDSSKVDNTTVDVVINLGAPKDMKDGANRVEDVCIALANSAEQFIKYLNVCAGQEVKGKTKAEAYASYMELTNGNPERKELEKAKKAAKEELDKAIDAIDDSTEEIKKKKASVKEDVHNLIDKSESMNDLDANLKSAKEAVDALIKEVQGEGELKDLKEAAKIQIQSVVDDQKDEKLKAILQDIATPALEKIDAAKTQEEITSILEAYQKDIQTAIDTYAKDKELAAAQAAAVKKLATLESKAKADYVTEDMKKIITTAKEEIQKAKTVDDVTKLYNQAKSDYNTAYVTSMRAVYEKKLDALLTDNKFTDATYLEKAKEVVTKQKANLKQAANEATMQEVYKVAKENVEKLVTAQSTAANLAQVKANAIQSLQNGYPNPSSATTKILEKYINKINSATSETEVNDIVQECKDVLKKTGIDYNNNNGGGNNGGDSDVTPTPGAGIDSDVTPTPSNSATPNGGTTTTLPGGGSSTGTGTGSTGTGDASQKGTSDVSAAGNVKTGDENMGIIAMAGAAILAAIAAAGISLRKFLKKDE